MINFWKFLKNPIIHPDNDHVHGKHEYLTPLANDKK